MIWAGCLAVLAVLALLGRTRLGFRGEYTRQEVGLWLRVGAFQWRLYPWRRKEGKQRPSGGEKPRKAPKSSEKKPPLLSPHGMFRLARRLLPVALEGGNAVRRRLQVDKLRLEIQVGGGDPAAAAERYGQIQALLGMVWEPLVQAFHIQDGRAHVDLDFDRQEPALYGTLALSLTASQLLWLGLQYGPRCLGIFLDVRKQDKAAGTQQRKAA